MFSADDARSHLMSKTGMTEETPFGPDVLVYKLGGKMVATLGFEKEIGQMNLKCDPDRSLELRDEYEAIIPGYHMNKKHWNTLILDGSLPIKLISELIDHSCELIFNALPAKVRKSLEQSD